MARPQSPLVGYNTNVRHRGKLYHIQTEDSGINHPHVITHLFADGGRIIASRKTSYAEHVGAEDLPAIVRKLMQEQHKGIFIELRDCVFDDDGPGAGEGAGEQDAAPTGAEASPALRAVGAEAQASGAQPEAKQQEAKQRETGQHEAEQVEPITTEPLAVPASQPVQVAAAPQPVPHEGAPASSGRPFPATPPKPASPRRVAASAPSDLSDLPAQALAQVPKRDVATREAAAAHGQDVGRSPDPDIQSLERAAAQRLAESAAGRAQQAASVRPHPPSVGANARVSGRYRPTVAARSNPEPPKTGRNGESIFGGQLLKGRSLDEVILSYLADDLGDGDH